MNLKINMFQAIYLKPFDKGAASLYEGATPKAQNSVNHWSYSQYSACDLIPAIQAGFLNRKQGLTGLKKSPKVFRQNTE